MNESMSENIRKRREKGDKFVNLCKLCTHVISGPHVFSVTQQTAAKN